MLGPVAATVMVVMLIFSTGGLKPIKKVVEPLRPGSVEKVEKKKKAQRKGKYRRKVRIPPREAVVFEENIRNPFIVLFAGKSGAIAGYYRVRGTIKHLGTKWGGFEVELDCEDDDCTVIDHNATNYVPGKIAFYTSEGCYIVWPSDRYLVSETEVNINKKPLVGNCTTKVK